MEKSSITLEKMLNISALRKSAFIQTIRPVPIDWPPNHFALHRVPPIQDKKRMSTETMAELQQAADQAEMPGDD
jgi:hypothetical protein